MINKRRKSIGIIILAFLFSIIYNAQYSSFISPFTVILIAGGVILSVNAILANNQREDYWHRLICCIVLGILYGGVQLISLFSCNNLWYSLKSFAGIAEMIVFFVTRVILVFLICQVLFFSCSKNRNEIGCNEETTASSERIFLMLWLLFALCWLPFCISGFPIRLGGGSNHQLMQFFGRNTKARQMSSLIYENSYITNHHPVLLTVFYGIFLKLGEWLNNVDEWAFFLSCITLMIISGCMAYCLGSIRKHVSKRVFLFVLTFVCIYPIYGIYSYATCKDNLYSAALVVFYTMMMNIVLNENGTIRTRKSKQAFFFITLIIPFLKNQGFLVVAISLVFLAIGKKALRKEALHNLLAVYIVYAIVSVQILFPALKIAPSGRQESLSIPFQQTALYVIRSGDDLSEEEYNAINAVLPIEKIYNNYNPHLADPVKFEFRQEATSLDIIRYLGAWCKGLIRHPITYIEAFVYMTNGYYDFSYKDLRLDLYAHKLELPVNISIPEWSYEKLGKQQECLEFLQNIPIIGCFFHIAAFSWLVLGTVFYCIYIRKYDWILILVPVLLSFAACLLGPWNGVFRYALPVIYAFPICLCLLCKRSR